MKGRTINILSREELERIPTKALLGRLKRLRQCEESLKLSDIEEPFDTGGAIFFKDTHEWQTAYEDVKLVLRTREHIPRNSKSHRIKQ